MGYTYTIKIGATTFTDMDKIVDSRTLKIVKPFCSTKKTSGTGTMSVTVKGAADTVYYKSFMMALLTAQQAQEVGDCEITVNDGNANVFCGYLDISTIQINSTKLPSDLNLSAKDKSILLDKKIRMNKAWENEKRSKIISDLLKYYEDHDYQIPVTLLSDDLPATKKIKRWAVAEGKEQTYREVIDKILLESAGYVLWYDPANDGFRIKAIQTDLTGLTPRVVSYLVKNQLQTRSEIYDKDGVLLSFPNVVERPNTNIYTENINPSIDDNNNYIGQNIPAGHYFPADGDIKEVYQQYRVPDRPYLSHESRLQNQDLNLIYCKDVTYSIACEPSLDLAPSIPGVNWDGTPDYYPDRARLLFVNNNPSNYFLSGDTSAIDAKDYYTYSNNHYTLVPSHTPVDNPKANGWYEAKGANLTIFSLTGTAVYEDHLNKVTVGRLDPDANGVPCTNPEEYKADTIQYMNGDADFSEALAFAKWYFKSLNYGQTISRWSEYDKQSYLGEVVYVAHKDTGIQMPHVVVQITDESVDGSRVRMNSIVAISIYGWEQYVYDNGISANGANGQQTQRANTISTGDLLVGETTCRGYAGIVGDIYINTDPDSPSYGNMYKCIKGGTAFSAIWQYEGNIKGKDADMTSQTYEIEYGLSTSDEECIFPVGTYGHDEDNSYGLDATDSLGFINYVWDNNYDNWYHGLYVWTRIKVTDGNGNVTYQEPTYAKNLTQSLIDSATVKVAALPSSYTCNKRRTDSQYLFLNIVDIGYKGTLVLQTSEGIFASYDSDLGTWTDLTNQITLSLNGSTVLNNYGVKLPYALDSNVAITGEFTEWDGSQFSMDELSISPFIEKNPVVQMKPVYAKADLPVSANPDDSDSGVALGNNLIDGDYVITRYVTLTPTGGVYYDDVDIEVSYDANKVYYTRSGDIFTVANIGAFDGTTTYYYFRVYPWRYNGTTNEWERTENGEIKYLTVQNIVKAAKEQSNAYPNANIDYHDCLYAYEAYIEELSVGLINAGDILAHDIKSYNYSEASDGTPTTGYYLHHGENAETDPGDIRSVGGIFNNMNVRGVLNLTKQGGGAGAQIFHPALETTEAIAGDPVGKDSVINGWKLEDLFSELKALSPLFDDTIVIFPTIDSYDATIDAIAIKTKDNSPPNHYSQFSQNIHLIPANTTYTTGASATMIFTSYKQSNLNLVVIPMSENSLISSSGYVNIYINGQSVWRMNITRSTPSNAPLRLDNGLLDLKYGDVISIEIEGDGITVTGGACMIKFATALAVGTNLWAKEVFQQKGVYIHKTNSNWQYLGYDTLFPLTTKYDLQIYDYTYSWISSAYKDPLVATFDTDDEASVSFPTTLAAYSSYYDSQSVLHTLVQGATYKVDGIFHDVAYNAFTPLFMTVDTLGTQISVSFSNGDTVVFNKNQGSPFYGHIAVEGTDEGVKTKGLYPNDNGSYDVGTPANPYDAGFFNTLTASLVNIGTASINYSSNNDYQGSIPLANGLILKYGAIMKDDGTRVYEIQFNTSFPNATLSISINRALPSGTTLGSIPRVYEIVPFNISKNGFKVGTEQIEYDSGNVSGYVSDYSYRPFYWMAIGY